MRSPLGHQAQLSSRPLQTAGTYVTVRRTRTRDQIRGDTARPTTRLLARTWWIVARVQLFPGPAWGRRNLAASWSGAAYFALGASGSAREIMFTDAARPPVPQRRPLLPCPRPGGQAVGTVEENYAEGNAEPPLAL